MPQLRILSINLLVDRAALDDLRAVITDADPDVVCTQEMGPETKTVVAEILPNGHLDSREDLFGMGIATKYPVVVDSLALAARSGWVARLDPDDWPNLTQPLDVFNVHLTNPVDFPWRRSRDERRGQIAQISTVVDQRNCAGVVVGDMNASPSWTEYKLLSEIGSDAARVTATEQRTWSHFLSGPRLLRIDHAFTIGVRPITTSVARVRGTDHRALIVDIEV